MAPIDATRGTFAIPRDPNPLLDSEKVSIPPRAAAPTGPGLANIYIPAGATQATPEAKATADALPPVTPIQPLL